MKSFRVYLQSIKCLLRIANMCTNTHFQINKSTFQIIAKCSHSVTKKPNNDNGTITNSVWQSQPTREVPVVTASSNFNLLSINDFRNLQQNYVLLDHYDLMQNESTIPEKKKKQLKPEQVNHAKNYQSTTTRLILQVR